jgi:hypothetical protein
MRGVAHGSVTLGGLVVRLDAANRAEQSGRFYQRTLQRPLYDEGRW